MGTPAACSPLARRAAPVLEREMFGEAVTGGERCVLIDHIQRRPSGALAGIRCSPETIRRRLLEPPFGSSFTWAHSM
jgi:hypothetical protein